MPIEWNGDEIADRVRAALGRGLVRATEGVRNEMTRLIQTSPHTGRVYKRRGVTHQASAPGEPPAIDTGRLVNSITTDYNLDDLVGRVIVGVSYGAYLEFGTEKMEPRPFARPALDNSREEIQEALKEEIRQELGS